MTNNRNPVKQMFLTFPKSNIDKATFRDLILRFEPTYYKVVEEKHKDGTPHLHALCKWKGKYSKAFVLKYFKAKLPDDYKRIDIQAVRSIKHAEAYLSKEDQSPLTSGAFIETRGNSKAKLIKSHILAMRKLGWKFTPEEIQFLENPVAYVEK